MVQVELSFKGAPPAQLGGGQTHIPEGKYLLEITNASYGKSKAGRDMFTIDFRVVQGGGQRPDEFAGKKLTEYFVVDRSDESKLFGLQRFHGFLQAVYGKEFGEASIRIDTDQLVGPKVICDVFDEEREATSDYPARVLSRCGAFYNPALFASKNGATPAAAPVAAPVAQAAPVQEAAPAPAPVAEAPAPAPAIESLGAPPGAGSDADTAAAVEALFD